MIESEQSYLTNNDIQDTITCNEFIQNLIKEGQTDQKLIKDFVRLEKYIINIYYKYTL